MWKTLSDKLLKIGEVMKDFDFEVSDEENEWIPTSHGKKDKKRQESRFIIFCC